MHCYALLCIAMHCYALLCIAMHCYAMLCCAILYIFCACHKMANLPNLMNSQTYAEIKIAERSKVWPWHAARIMNAIISGTLSEEIRRADYYLSARVMPQSYVGAILALCGEYGTSEIMEYAVNFIRSPNDYLQLALECAHYNNVNLFRHLISGFSLAEVNTATIHSIVEACVFRNITVGHTDLYHYARRNHAGVNFDSSIFLRAYESGNSAVFAELARLPNTSTRNVLMQLIQTPSNLCKTRGADLLRELLTRDVEYGARISAEQIKIFLPHLSAATSEQLGVILEKYQQDLMRTPSPLISGRMGRAQIAIISSGPSTPRGQNRSSGSFTQPILPLARNMAANGASVTNDLARSTLVNELAELYGRASILGADGIELMLYMIDQQYVDISAAEIRAKINLSSVLKTQNISYIRRYLDIRERSVSDDVLDSADYKYSMISELIFGCADVRGADDDFIRSICGLAELRYDIGADEFYDCIRSSAAMLIDRVCSSFVIGIAQHFGADFWAREFNISEYFDNIDSIGLVQHDICNMLNSGAESIHLRYIQMICDKCGDTNLIYGCIDSAIKKCIAKNMSIHVFLLMQLRIY
jgi:hypothetical protein